MPILYDSRKMNSGIRKGYIALRFPTFLFFFRSGKIVSEVTLVVSRDNPKQSVL